MSTDLDVLQILGGYAAAAIEHARDTDRHRLGSAGTDPVTPPRTDVEPNPS